uniref:WW domain-containing protein n=1 Tax=Aegilops tauschii TaxID=37682 RepID=M8BX28_AEGTA
MAAASQLWPRRRRSLHQNSDARCMAAPAVSMAVASQLRQSLHRSFGGVPTVVAELVVVLGAQQRALHGWCLCCVRGKMLTGNTGQVYYINWEDGTRTTIDPRTPSLCSALSTPRSTCFTSHRAAFTSSSSSGYTSAASSVTGGYGYGYDDSDGYSEGYGDDEESSSSSSRSSGVSSVLSSFFPSNEPASSDSGHATSHVLVAVGCRACFMCFMVPRSVGLCPKCGSSGLLHLGASYA